MEPSREGYRKMPRSLYKTFQIGSSKISGSQINVPAQVMKNYNLKEGDNLEWYPCSTEFPDEKEKEVIALLIVRQKAKKEHG